MTKLGRRKPNPFKWIRFRIVVVGSVLGIFLVLIVGRAFQLQVLQSERLQSKAAGQYKKAFEDQSKRGTIYDRNHEELAASLDVTSICAYPREITSPTKVATALARVLKLDQARLLAKLRSDRYFTWIERHVNPEDVAAVKALGLNGVGFRTESRRFYPHKSLAAQVVGFSGTDGTGLEGLEFYYNDVLKGQESKWTVLRDALGRGFATPASASEGKAGLNLVLTIDKNIQYIAEEALFEGVNTFSAKSGIALVMAPGTGEILAMAHVPRFNPNAFNQYNRWSWRNRVITDSFEPGSTFKIFLVATALESGLCTPASKFYCEKGSYRVGRNVVHDIHPHDTLSLQDILKYSSNIGAAKVGEVVGSAYFYHKLLDFGFGGTFGVDASGETRGRLRPAEKWTAIDAVAVCFGQGVAVSVLQLGTALSAIANDGLLMKPHLVKEITGSRGRVVKTFQPTPLRRVISPENAWRVKRMMERTVEKGGTGVRAALNGYAVGGKTGTAQKVDPAVGGYAQDKHIASFIGFVPVESPEIVVVVVIDEPKKRHYGGVVSAPVFKRIAQETLRYLKVPPELATPEWTDAMPDHPGARADEETGQAPRIS